MEKLIEILNELHDDVDFENENALIDDGILDSLDIVTLITEINDTFDVSIPAEEIIPENFNSIGVKLAKAAGVPVLPLALKTDFTKNGKFVRDMGAICPEHEVWFEFAPAVEIEGNGHEQHREIVEFIKSRIDSWKAAEGR